MKHKDIEYRVLQTANPTGWKWTVIMDEKRTKTGESRSRSGAILNAIRTIDKALASSAKPDDPLRSDAIGWLSGELARAPITHTVREGRMIPKRVK
jgi:hypothetical protein